MRLHILIIIIQEYNITFILKVQLSWSLVRHNLLTFDNSLSKYTDLNKVSGFQTKAPLLPVDCLTTSLKLRADELLGLQHNTVCPSQQNSTFL